MKYAKPIDNIYRTPSHPTQGGQKKATSYQVYSGRLTYLGKLIQRNLGRRGLTLAIKLEKALSCKNKYADQRI